MIENNYIIFKQPKLFFINKTQDLNIFNQLNKDFERKEKQLQKRIENLNNHHKENKEEELQNEISKNPENFFQNPFKYMDYLAKKYCTENVNILENLKIKQDMTNNFHKLCNQIEGHIKVYTANEERRLNDLKKEVDKKLNGDTLPIEEEKFQNMNNINNNNPNLKSSPMTMDDQEFLSRVIGYQGSYGSSPLDGIITNGNAVNYVNNNKKSYLNEDNLYINALSCLKGDKLIAPKNNFIAIKELSLNDIDQNKIKDTQNITDLKTKMQIEQYNKEIMGDKNNKKIKNKINNIKKNEKKNLEDLISYSNNHINNMKQYQKEKNELIKNLKNKLNKDFEANAIKLAMSKLSICDQNLSQIKAGTGNNYYNNSNIKIPQNSLIDWKERKEILDKEFNDTQKMVNNFLNGRGTSLTKSLKKGNINKKKKKRNNSAIPYNNKKYYNYKKY